MKWRGKLYCFTAFQDYVRASSNRLGEQYDPPGLIENRKIVTPEGKAYGLAWRDIRFEGAVYYHEGHGKERKRIDIARFHHNFSDDNEYQGFAALITDFLSEYRFIDAYPVVRLLTFKEALPNTAIELSYEDA